MKKGVSVLRAEYSNPAAWQPIAAGLYAGGFAALTVLRNEAAAAFAIQMSFAAFDAAETTQATVDSTQCETRYGDNAEIMCK